MILAAYVGQIQWCIFLISRLCFIILPNFHLVGGFRAKRLDEFMPQMERDPQHSRAIATPLLLHSLCTFTVTGSFLAKLKNGAKMFISKCGQPALWVNNSDHKNMFISSHKLRTCTLPGWPSYGLRHCLLESWISTMHSRKSPEIIFLLFKDFFLHCSQNVFHAFLMYLESILKNSLFWQILQPVIVIKWSSDPIFFLSQTKICIKLRLRCPFKREI